MPLKSPWTDIQVPLTDVWSFYFTTPREYPENHVIFYEAETDRGYTFADLRHFSTSFGAGLKHALSWKKGDVLAVYAPNNIDIPAVNFGLQWAGGVLSPANPTYTVSELARQLKDSQAKALVTTKQFLDKALEAAELVGLSVDRVLLMGQDTDGRCRHWKDITDKGAWIKPRKTTIDPKKDLAYLVYSSGTMGLPKGVMLTHYNMVSHGLQMSRMDVRSLTWETDSQIGILPWFHIYGLAVVINVTLVSGAKCITMAKFNLEKFCSIIQERAVSFIYVPPPIVLALGKSPVVDKYDMSSIRFITSAAAPLSRDLVDAVWNRHHVGVKQGYGLTETSPTVTKQMPDEWMRFQGSVGRLVPSMEAKIVDEKGKEVPTGESGELLVKGPNVFGGYWNRPELSKETFTDDGWYRTGDIFKVDKWGNFYVTDRMKELIKYKGFQVPPAELEAKIIGRNDVADVCVIGVWDKQEYTEVPRAYIALSPGVDGSDALAKEIAEWFNGQVSSTKRLRGGVKFVDEIPKSASGKILRRVLKDQVKKWDEAEQVKAKL